MSNGKRWTPDEDARLREMSAAKQSVHAMAIDLGRSEPAVRARLPKLNLNQQTSHQNAGILPRRWRPTLGIGSLAALVVVLGFAFEEYDKTFPIADAKGDYDEVHPFSNTLTIKNPSAIFDMHHVTVNCELAAIFAAGPTLRGQDGFTYRTEAINAHEPFVFMSEVANSFFFGREGATKSAPLKHGLIVVKISYETWFGLPNFEFRWRREQPVYLTFVQYPAPHWISGTEIF
jgi:hypothetical protein